MFDGNGNLPSGFHEWTFQDIKANLVDKFPSSLTRGKIFNGYSRLRDVVITLKIQQVTHWIDGSFSTQKENPNDIDLLTIIPAAVLNAVPPALLPMIRATVAGPASKTAYHCDSYLLAEYPQGDPYYEWYRKLRKYWYGEFGLDRQDHPKGIVTHRVEVMP